MRRTSASIVWARSLGVLALLVAAAALYWGAPRPFPRRTFPDRDLFTVIGTIPADPGPSNAHGTAVMLDGVLVIPFAHPVVGRGPGGFSFFDLANPYRPKLLQRFDSNDTREGHSIGFHIADGRTYAVTQANEGIDIWDWTDLTTPKLISSLQIPGLSASDYDTGAWWVFWQAPVIFVGGNAKGIFVVDAAELTRPRILARMTSDEYGGFKVGAVHAVGNLLTALGADVRGMATIDIGDPAHPRLLSTNQDFKSYSGMVNGGELLVAVAQSDGSPVVNGLATFDLSNPSESRYLGGVTTYVGGRDNIDGRGGYLTVQDGFAHLGSSVAYYKIDLSSHRIVGEISYPPSPGISMIDLDFVSVVGNVVIMGDDDGNGSRIGVHQTEPDRTPPKVTMVHPPAGALGAPLTSRVGVTFSDQISLRSLAGAGFTLRALPDGSPLEGRLSGQTGIANFSPKAPLSRGTTYEVRVRGAQDVSANIMVGEFVSQFTTVP